MPTLEAPSRLRPMIESATMSIAAPWSGTLLSNTSLFITIVAVGVSKPSTPNLA